MDTANIKTRRETKGKGKGPKEKGGKGPYSAKHVRIVEAVKAKAPPKK